MDIPAQALCIACNYPLRGLETSRCPECGREFDPASPRTMNLGRPIGRFTRALLSHTGWPTVALALFATIAVFYAGGIPPIAAKPMLRDLVLALSWPKYRWDIVLPEAVFMAAVWVWTLAAGWYVFRTFARWWLRWRRQQPPIYFKYARWRRIAFVLLFVVSAGLALYGWPIRSAKSLVARHGMGTEWTTQLPSGDKETAFRAGVVGMPTLAARREMLARLVALSPDATKAFLPTAIARERAAHLRADHIHVLTLYHDPAHADLFVKLLDDPQAPVRAAAADAIGYLSGQRISATSEWWSRGGYTLSGNPPIDVESIFLDRNTFIPSDAQVHPNSVAFPLPVRDKLERIMTSGPSQAEREAAARTLAAWPPPAYSLRVAEWGVWLADGADLKLVKQIEDEIPPFVHRVGNRYDSLSDRYMQWMGDVTKPIIHFTADRPLALDVEVHIRNGRPLYAYPLPDDLALGHRDSTGISIQTLDRKEMPPLTDLREGYPWLLPGHRLHPLRSSQRGNWRGNKVEATDLGLRWQSLIILPEQAAWMNPPQIPAGDRYRWWADLRKVPSSFIASRGESERFLFYDGATLSKAPVAASLSGDRLVLQTTPEDKLEAPYQIAHRFDPIAQNYTDLRRRREGFLIHVAADNVTARRFNVTADSPAQNLNDPWSISGIKNAQAEFLKLLTDYGVTAPEAQGLVDAWRKLLFEAPGTRFLLRMSAADYDRLCPISIKPAPTEMIRLGLILTEFDRP